MPSQAVSEMEANDELVFDVMESRAYSRTKQAIDVAQSDKEIPKSGMVDWVFAVQAELLRRRNARE